MSSKTKVVLVLASVMLAISAGFFLSLQQISGAVRTLASAIWGA